MTMIPTFPKDPEAVLDYSYSWTTWLAKLETIVTALVTVPAGLTLNSQTNDSKTVTVWISGGVEGEDYILSCRITTSENRTDTRRIALEVRKR